MGSSDARLVDFAQTRVNRIADAIDALTEQIKLTNSHVERLNREIGDVRGETGGLRRGVAELRVEIAQRFDALDSKFRELGSEVILQANHIINAQQQATRAMMRLDDIERPPDEPKP